MPDSLGVVVLAAGHGTRMKSSLHKVLHPIAGRPMIDYVLSAAEELRPARTVVVVGHDAEAVRSHLNTRAEIALQDPPRGTGDAVRTAAGALAGKAGTVLVLYGDTPLVTSRTLRELLDVHKQQKPLVTILTGLTHDPGRVLRDPAGRLTGIVEEKLASPAELQVPERNSGVCAFDAEWLWPALDQLQPSGTGEYLLTDLVALAIAEGERRPSWPVASLQLSDPVEAMGINNRVQLAQAEQVVRARLVDWLMLSGVTVLDPATTYVHAGVEVGRDATILPNTHLYGATRVGEGSVIGPSTLLQDSIVGDRCRVQWSVLEQAYVGSHSDVGPFSHLRRGTHIDEHVHIGNFVETKNTRIGSGTASGHVSYLGDATVGRNVNIGAGSITANYDGVNKHPTIIGDGAFIGCDTMLRAPVEVGENAATGTGAVVTRNVPPDTLVVGLPARAVPRHARRRPSPAASASDKETEQ